MNTDLTRSIEQATTIDELVRQFEALLAVDISDTPKGHQRLKANQLAKDILAKYNGDYSNVSPEDKAALRDYTGFGGIGGSTNEYYTPKWLASATWGAVRSYGFTGGSVLEPSSGVGVFSETKPKGTLTTSVEMDQTSAAINQILHPEDHVIQSAFEAVATNPGIGDFDLVIGNPPYGVRDASAMKDKAYKDIKYADQYFVSRSIDKAKAGGLIALVLPTRICDAKNLEKWRTQLALKAEFLGAHRLPTGTFSDTGVVTDLVIWRKHSDQAKALIDSADRDTLIESNVLWDTWLKGKWFEREGKKFINGEQTVEGVGKFARKVVKRGNRSNDDIKESLMRRFDSRIDWMLLDEAVSEPVSAKYSDGDTIFRNGQQYEMIDGEWELSESNAKTGVISKATYGIDNTDEIGSITYSTESMLKLSASQALKLFEDYGYLCHDDFKALMREIAKLPKASQEHAYKGILLGMKVQTLATLVAGSRTTSNSDLANMAMGAEDFQTEQYRVKLSGEVLELNALMGGSKVSKKALSNLSEKYVSAWNYYHSSIDSKGKLSDLLKGDLKRELTVQYSSSRIGDVFHLCDRELGITTLTLHDVRTYYTASGIDAMSDEQLLDYLANMDEVAVNPDGTVTAFHKATTGLVGKRMDQLTAQLVSTTSDTVKANIMRQIQAIESKRNKISIADVKMKLTDKWIPKNIMLEFLHDRGYTEFILGDFTEDKDGFEDFVQSESGQYLTGYRWRDGEWIDGLTRNGVKGKAANSDERFERQIESYINYGAVRGGSKNEDKSLIREQMRRLDDEFSTWIASSDHSEYLEQVYNNTFNGWIKPEFDDSPLTLNGVSGAIEFLPYQNSTIRRHSADGNGIIAFGTGLGKTLTGLGLVQHNLETKRANRVAIVVPKSVLENWFYESDLFFGESNLSDKVFIGLEVHKDDDGKIIREPVLDETGEPKLDKKGDPILRAKLTVDTNGKRVAEQLHQLTQSTARIVVMTKDVYNRIPLKPDTISANVLEMRDAGLIAGSSKLVKEAESHTDQAKNARFEAKYADDGTAKNEELPYFEDLLFDSVMVDEAHDFRNSYKGGSYRNNLAFLPSQAQADRAIDMQLKNNVIKARNDGRGVYFLTATPTVNSPVDMFNMLSHIIPADTFAKMGIFDSDDFIRMFGKTGEALVTKISGEVEQREALLGFQNLDALRNIVNRYMTIEDAKSVGANVHIPDLISQQSVVQMNSEQEALYEELRQRADAISNPDKDENQEIVEQYPNDTVFGLIRKMDKLSTDLDLYYERVTYRFAKDSKKEVEAAVAKLPNTVTVAFEDVAPDGTVKLSKIQVKVDKSVKVEGDHCVVQLHQQLDDRFTNICDKAKLKFTHPVSPKYAKFLESAREIYLAGGKQLVFTEEKTQHKKVARIIADFVGCKLSEIGILNSDTVAGKKGSKATEDDEEAGLEAMANAYNTSKYKFMILNKKGEVGINLHHGTTDIHHLTLPWTPMSITQRNGRGARVGSKQNCVNVHYYTSKGSFDDFRLATIQRKATWIETMFKGDEKYIANADADAADETAIMLAANPEEAKARIEAAKRQAERKRKLEERRLASINVSKYIKATQMLALDVSAVEGELAELREKLEPLRKEVEEDRLRAEGEKRGSWLHKNYQRTKGRLFALESQIKTYEAAIKNRDKASDTIKKLKPAMELAINDGVLKDYPDFLTHPELYIVRNGVIVRNGYTYKAEVKSRSWSAEYDSKATIMITNFDRKSGTVDGFITEMDGEPASRNYVDLPVERIIEIAPVNQDRAALEAKALQGVPLSEVAHTFDRETFFELVAEKKMKAYGNSRRCLVRNADGSFSTPWGLDVEPDQTLIYPDASDKAIVKALLDQVTKQLEDKGRVMLEHDILSFFIGSDWDKQAMENGNQVSEQEVVELVTLEIKAFEEKYPELYQEALLKAETTYKTSITFLKELDNHLSNLKWTGYTNAHEARRLSAREFTRYTDILTERSSEYRTELEDKLFADFTKLVANDPDRAKRLSQIAYWMTQYKPTTDTHLLKKVDAIYGENSQETMLKVCADLHAIGEREFLSGDGLIFSDDWSLNRMKGAYGSLFTYRSAQREEFIEKYLNADKPEKAEVKVTETQKVKIDNISAINVESIEKFSELMSGIGIDVKMVTSPISWKPKRGRNRKEIVVEPYERIGLMDNNGLKGSLKVMFAGDKEAKAEYGADFASNASSEFNGGWWFISAKADLELLAKSLLTIHNTMAEAA
ncbi:TPA: SNF2-related protein [Vibrio alginolyticus]